MDTDAAGIWHHSTVTRWTEDAEAELHRRLGIIGETFGATPRAHVEFDFLVPLSFDEEVKVHLAVARVGESSVEYEIVVYRDEVKAVTGRLVAVLIDRATRKRRPWPPHLRQKLSGETEPG